MSNPNNCSTCDHKRNPDDGWCYMFREEPTEVCYIHTGRKLSFFALQKLSQPQRKDSHER